MATILPFKAVRPAVSQVKDVVSNTYESYTKTERDNILAQSPTSFLGILGANETNPIGSLGDSQSDRFRNIRARYLEHKSCGIFQQDPQSCYYVLQIESITGHFCGIIALANIRDYENNRIKKHEKIIRSRAELFQKYLETVAFQAESVLLTYPDSTAIADILDKAKQETPVYTVSWEDEKHVFWKIDHSEQITQIQREFANIPALYIADGHHRSASSLLVAQNQNIRNIQTYSPDALDRFMVYLVPESQIKISSFYRLVTDLNGLSEQEFLDQLAPFFRVQKEDNTFGVSDQKKIIRMHLRSATYTLECKHEQDGQSNDILEDLDVSLLYKRVLQTFLGITSLKSDSRLAYIAQKKGVRHIQGLLDRGEYAVAFGLPAVSIEEIKAIADSDKTLPPKTTYIEPKLKSGITIYEYY